MLRIPRKARYAAGAALALFLGTGIFANVDRPGVPIGSLFYLPLVNNVPTTPCKHL